VDVERMLTARPQVGDQSPSPEVSPSETLRILAATEPPSEVLPFPRRNDKGEPAFEYRMRVLTQYEIDLCCANSEQYSRKLLQGQLKITDEQVKHVRNETWRDVYENAKLIELLFTACRDKDDPKRKLFDAPGQLRKLLTADECAALFQAYQLVQGKYGPLWSQLSDEQIEEWIDRIVKGADLHPLSQLEPVALAMLVVGMAYRIRALRTGTGSSGSDSSDGALVSSPSPSETVSE